MLRRTMLVAVVAMLATPMLALAQNPGGNDGGRKGFDPAQMRERMMNMYKEQLGATDDEWKVLQPKVEKVMTVQRDTRGGGFGGFGRRGGGDAPAPETLSPVQKAMNDLRTALENKDTPADTIAERLKALREAREKAKETLAAAQKELKELLTQRQEAVLVSMGMLE